MTDRKMLKAHLIMCSISVVPLKATRFPAFHSRSISNIGKKVKLSVLLAVITHGQSKAFELS
jgi:hypothetical protein